MKFKTNPQIELAFNYVRNTNMNIFLTGKAGTGKTTFLLKIKKEAIKRMVIVAPTGVAAINAGGMTIHSFFQLSFGPQIPGAIDNKNRFKKLKSEKINLIKSLDLLVIDEISMVRADLLDGIDRVLRQYRDRSKPFGGVQLLMIGDLHQLPPIVKPEEWNLLRQHYKTSYFFGSLALRQSRMVTIQLKHVYRQSDESFIKLLNRVRSNQMDTEVLQKLNSRYQAILPDDKEDYITLTAMNAPAKRINIEKLESISNLSHFFEAKIEDNFPSHAYPTDENLELKIDAQVMFVKNDPSFNKYFYNGKIGRITKIVDDLIYVQCKGEANPIPVSPLEWTNVKYNLNKKTKEVTENIEGSFTQFPLKLAWAITIHKSQGLTFERVIIDAQNAFAHGQTYVALSRCKSFEGIVLRSKLVSSSVKTDVVVQHYSQNAEKNAPTEADLDQAKRTYQHSLLLELFDFKVLKQSIGLLSRLFIEYDLTITEPALHRFLGLEDTANSDVITMGMKFVPSLQNYFRDDRIPEDNEELQARLKKASSYFIDKLANVLLVEANGLQIISDNDKVRQKAQEGIKNLIKELTIKIACFRVCGSGFTVKDYLNAKTNTAIDFLPSSFSAAQKNKAKAGEDTDHPLLFNRITKWRDDKASELDLKPNQILTIKSIMDIVKLLPTGVGLLRKIKGIGAVKSKKYGVEIISIIKKYVDDNRVSSDFKPNSNSSKNVDLDSKTVSFDSFNKGNSIVEIAKSRDLVASTIEGHLSFFIENGELDIYKLVDKKSVSEIMQFLDEHKDSGTADLKDHFGNKYSYGVLKMVKAHISQI